MNWDAIGAVGEVGGAIAVVGSLIYLARQIRHNSDTERASAELEHSRMIADFHSQFTNNTDLIPIWRAAFEDATSLSPLQHSTFIFLIAGLFGRFEGVFNFYQRGSITRADWEPYEETLVAFLKNPAVRTWWDSRATPFRPAFRDHIGSIRDRETDWTPHKALRGFGPSEGTDP